MLKTTKNRQTYFYLIKAFLFLIVIYILYSQLLPVLDTEWMEFSMNRPWLYFPVILLVIPNIWLTYVMWTESLQLAHIESGRSVRRHSFFAGLLTGFMTPNMLGNFVGRAYYFDKVYAAEITGLTFFTNFSQLLSTILFGVAGLFMIDTSAFAPPFLRLLALLMVPVLLLLYFFFERLIPDRIFKWDFQSLKNHLKRAFRFKLYMLTLALFRHLIFSGQLLLMLMCFGIKADMQLVAGIWIVYILTMLAPSLFFGKIGIKETISVIVLGSMGVNQLAILSASLSIWFLNTFAPVVFALVVVKQRGLK